VLGLDANAAAMAESSRRAARPSSKGGLPNLLFAVAAAERPPPDLRGRVHEVRVLFPWGSLLRGVLALDEDVAAGIAALVAPGGVIRALVSVAERDAATLGVPPLIATDRDAIARRWTTHGLAPTCFEPAISHVIEATGSSWGRRLTATGATRSVWELELRPGSGRPGRAG